MRIVTLFSLLALTAAVLAPGLAAQTAEEDFLALDRAFRSAAERIAPAVVHIEVDRIRDIGVPAAPRPGTKPPRRTGFSLPSRLLEKFQENRYLNARPKGGTSGVLISSEGHILTNEYNVAGQIKGIRVTLHDGRSFAAKIVAKDINKGLSLLKIEGEDLPHATLSRAVNIEPGRFCAVVGRGLSHSNPTLTTGIVSARRRNRGEFFQFSARVNYENSGGAVVDLRGRLLGIVCRVSHVPQLNRCGINTGVSQGAPAPKILDVLDRLKAGQDIPRFPGPFLGIRFDLKYEDKGVKIEYVYKDLPSRKAGLLPGDIIVSFNNIQIESRNDLIFAIHQCDPNEKVGFTVKRMVDGEEEHVDLTAVLTIRPPQAELEKLAQEYAAWKKAQDENKKNGN